ncbi:MAG: MurR/RpiR family transcriptional regulator [Traorella sp.]
MTNILQKLRERDKLSNSEAIIAKYICANPEKVVRMSVREIANETFTSPNSVMRLCRKICNDGFAEFRIQLAQEVQLRKTNDKMTKAQIDLAKKMESINEVMNELKINVINSIEATQQLINADIVTRVIKLINQSKVIDIYGRGSSNSVGLDFRYKLFRLGYQVFIFEGLDLQAIQALNSDPSHCAIVISSTGETPEIINFADILNKKGTPVVTITGSQDCTLLKYSDYPLFFKCFEDNERVGGITSRSATQYVLDIIYFSLLNSDYEKHTQTILNNYVPEDIATKKKKTDD